MLYLSTNRPRKGAIAPMTAILTVAILALVALAIDLSWIVLVSTELQNAADASALAASNKLMDNYVLYNMPKQSDDQKAYLLGQAMDNARVAAKTLATKNAAGAVPSLVLLDQDIGFGYVDEKDQFTPYPDCACYPNTVRVQLRRDESANSPLDLFFAPVFRMTKGKGDPYHKTLVANASSSTTRINLMRSASASLNGGFVSSFTNKSHSLAVLPITLDRDQWNEFLKTGIDPSTNQVRKDAEGNPMMKIYSEFQSKGNFGQLSLNGIHTGNSDTVNWINNGMDANDVKSLQDLNLLPISPANSKWNWIGNPGFKASSVMAVNDYIGKVYLLPLFQAKNSDAANYEAGLGQGSNYYYNIVQFVGVRIMPTSNINGEIIVQPAAVSNPDLVFAQGATPAPKVGANEPVITTFSTPRLTK